MLKKCTKWIHGQVETNVCKQPKKEKFYYDIKHSHLWITIAFTLYVVHPFFVFHVFNPEKLIFIKDSKRDSKKGDKMKH